MATPSTLGSLENTSRARSRSGTGRRRRSAQARRSSSAKALSRLIMGTRCRTSLRTGRAGPPPTVWVGESGVTRVGMAGLEVPQLADQEVELGVGDLRRVQRVVPLVVVGDELAQLGGPSRRGRVRRVGPLRQPRSPARPRSSGDARADHRVRIARCRRGPRSAPPPPGAGVRRTPPSARHRSARVSTGPAVRGR